MQFPTRPLLALAVIGTFVASGGTALTLTANAVPDEVGVPEFATPSQPQSASVPIASTPPVTGAQIAALAIAPARERAAAIAAEQAKAAAAAAAAAKASADAEAERTAARPESRNDRLRAEIKQACAIGLIRGPVCRG
ncbi:hypothetical protein [Pseudonocardia sp. GCM10023141]|uniref:hypothetical protein n=1 Tax=Pseudonocardia sp. GCM10023141 TaxID=3252653 RepID=UPI00361E0244